MIAKDKKRITLTLKRKSLGQIRDISTAVGITPSDLIQQLIDKHLDQLVRDEKLQDKTT